MRLTGKHMAQVKEYANVLQTYLPYDGPTIEVLLNVISGYIKAGDFNPDRLHGEFRRLFKKYYPYGLKFNRNTARMDDGYVNGMAEAVTAWMPFNDRMREAVFMRMARMCRDLPLMVDGDGDKAWQATGCMYGEIRKVADMI